MSRYAQLFAERLAPHLDLAVEAIAADIETPPRPDLGQLAFPCFALAKTLRKAPVAIAAELAGKIEAGGLIESVTAEGPYVNAHLDGAQIAAQVLGEVVAAGAAYGSSDFGQGGVVPVDFSSPNIAKPFGIHHLRSTVIGHALVGMLDAAGFKPVGINHIGDWGTQFGQLLAVWEQEGDEERLQAEGIHYLLQLYVEFNKRKEADPDLQEVARARFKALEDGDAEARRLWSLFRDVSLAEFERVYALLGIRFDAVVGESFYEDLMAPVLDELAGAGLLTESDDATVVDLEAHDLGVALVRKRELEHLRVRARAVRRGRGAIAALRADDQGARAARAALGRARGARPVRDDALQGPQDGHAHGRRSAARGRPGPGRGPGQGDDRARRAREGPRSAR